MSEIPEKYIDFMLMNQRLLILPIGATWQKQSSNANNYMWRYDDLSALMVRQPNDKKDLAEVYNAETILKGKGKRRITFTVNPLIFENGMVAYEKEFSKSGLVKIIKSHREMAKTFEVYTCILLKEAFELADLS